jgi:hypothetical protein
MRNISRCCLIWSVAAGLLLTMTVSSFGAEAEHHSLVRFWIDTPADQEFMDQNHLRFQIAYGRSGDFFDLVVRPEEVPELMRAGSRVEVLHHDMEGFYASRMRGRADWGDFHTYSEAIALMDSLHMLYPSVVSARWSIGQGHEGNDIWCFRVSDNPEVDEPDEPEVLFDGLHHANEIMGSEVTLMLAEYLAEQYTAGDPEISQLLNEREVYMVPILNPDGMLYNEAVYPNGGASWRKNRRDNGDGTWGVDLNRNYSYEWGCDEGSSGNPGDPTYRGPAPQSEPEVQAVVAFINAHEFITRQSYHSSGNVTLYPWGYTRDDTPDEDIFREMAAAMTLYNGYRAGQPGDPGILYIACGGAFDWDYGAQDEHEKIFGFSNELGTSQWPPESQRQPIFEDNIWPAIYLIQMAGSLRGVSWIHTPLPYTAKGAQPYPLVAVPMGYEGAPIDTSSVTLHFRVDGGAFSDVPMVPTGQPGEFGASIPGQFQGTVVEYYLSASDIEGRQGTSPRNAPSALHYFEVGREFVHPMEADRGWTVGDSDDDAGTGIWVRVDPIGTPAQPEDDHSPDGTHCWITGQHAEGGSIGHNDVDGGKTTLFSPIYDLEGALSVAFEYWRWYSNSEGTNPNEDWWDVLLSNDGGESWVSLEHTQESSNAWESLSFDLEDFYPVPGQVQLKFVASDEGGGSIVEAGVDDFSIAGVFEISGSPDLSTAFQLSLEQNYPNPFHPETTIRFRHPVAGPVRLGVYDASGRLLRVLLSASVGAGDYAVSWDGRDALGRPVASGIYFARLQTEGGELNCRMVLMK